MPQTKFFFAVFSLALILSGLTLSAQAQIRVGSKEQQAPQHLSFTEQRSKPDEPSVQVEVAGRQRSYRLLNTRQKLPLRTCEAQSGYAQLIFRLVRILGAEDAWSDYLEKVTVVVPKNVPNWDDEKVIFTMRQFTGEPLVMAPGSPRATLPATMPENGLTPQPLVACDWGKILSDNHFLLPTHLPDDSSAAKKTSRRHGRAIAYRHRGATHTQPRGRGSVRRGGRRR